MRRGQSLFWAAAAYLFAVMPGHREKRLQTDTVFFAHRGLHDNNTDAPENTLRAFAKACDAGYGIELDVQLTADGQVVVFHDSTLARVCGVDGLLKTYTYAQLQEIPIRGTDQRMPLFTDVLRLVDGRVPLIVELKFDAFDEALCEKTDAILQNYRGAYCVESFQPSALMWYRRHRPDVCRGQLSMNYQRAEKDYRAASICARHLLFNFLTKPDFIAYDIRDASAVSKTLCRSLFGCPCYAWTVKSEAQLTKCRPYYDYFIFEGFRPEA